MDKKTKTFLDDLNKKVVETSEAEFLQYLIDCCENVLEEEEYIKPLLGHPVAMQLIKLRAEVTQRLQNKFGIEYGKFATADHILSHKKQK